MYIEPQSDAFSGEMLCLKFTKEWSENFKDEMLSLEETWEDVMTGFQEMTGVIEEMKEAMRHFMKVFSEYEWLETHARVEVLNEQEHTDSN